MELVYLNFQYFFDTYPPIIKSNTFWAILLVSVSAIVIAFLIKFLIFGNQLSNLKK